jgi:hypothetical protein
MATPAQLTDQLCVVCRRREPDDGYICSADRRHIVDMLTDLPRKVSRLHLRLAPSSVGATEHVATSRAASPIPARLDALTLIGPGNVAVTTLGRTRTTRTAVVTRAVGTRLVREVRRVVEWRYSTAPAAPANDDQVGPIPPAEWADSWVRDWRRQLGHHVPSRTRPVQPADRHAERAAFVRSMVAGASNPATSAAVAAIAAVFRAGRQANIDTLLGRVDGYGGLAPTAERQADPVGEEWRIRFGDMAHPTMLQADVDYLLTWLDEACRRDLGVADFAVELRALSNDLTHVLGEGADQQWLGRCPSFVAEASDAATRPCGAGLWQDPHASQVQCPRCHSVWGPKRFELLLLASEIRRVWPVDRRRRYNADDIDALRVPHCQVCGSTRRVWWREVTATTEARRWWRPDRITCPAGCEEGTPE